MNYTKGPWMVDPETGEIVCNDSMILGIVFGANDYPCYDGDVDIAAECEANAHLIAAAPEMYEALKEIRQIVSDSAYRQATKEQIIGGKCFLALAKAEGGK